MPMVMLVLHKISLFKKIHYHPFTTWEGSNVVLGGTGNYEEKHMFGCGVN